MQLAVSHLLRRAVQHLGLLVAEGNEALVDVVADEQEYVNERHAVGRDAAHQLAVVLMLRGVGGVDQLRQLVVDIRQLRELARGQLVGQGVAVHRLDVGKPHRVVDLRHRVQLVQDHALLLIVAGRHHHRHQIGRGEVLLDHVRRDLLLVELWRHDGVIAVDIGAAARYEVCRHHQSREHERDHEPRGVGELADKGDLGDKVLVPRLVHQRTEEHQQSRHEHKHGEQRVEDRLDETDAHVGTEAELHEQHRHQTADGREAAGADLGDALAQRNDRRLTGGQGLVLLLEAVAEDDRVVQRQRQLEDARDRVGDEGDLPQQEVAAHVEHHGAHKRQAQHGDLRVGLGGQDQHRHDDDRHDNHDDAHLRGDDLRQLVAQRSAEVGVVGRVAVENNVQRIEAAVVLLRVAERDVIEGGDVVVVVGGVVEVHALHAVRRRDLVRDLLRPRVGDVRHHQLCRAEGGELLAHDVEALAGLRGLRQIGSEVVLHLHPVAGDDGEHQRNAHQQEHKVPLVDNKGGELRHKARLCFFSLCAHGILPLAKFTNYSHQYNIKI